MFWDTLGPERVASMFKALGDQRVTARTHVAYIDGKTIRTCEGAVNGRFAEEPRGSRDFQWDCVFIPDSYDLTFAEMGADEKNKISMRRRALDALAAVVAKL